MKQVDSHALFLSLRGGQFSDEVELENEAKDDEVDEVELLLFALMEWGRGQLPSKTFSSYAKLPRRLPRSFRGIRAVNLCMKARGVNCLYFASCLRFARFVSVAGVGREALKIKDAAHMTCSTWLPQSFRVV